jgi:hypothetical protein
MSNNKFGFRTRTGLIKDIPVGLSVYDADAQAFINTAGITDVTQQDAISKLVQDFKSYGIWTKMKAIYPFVGGTATAHSINLKNTAQYQVTWVGGMIHDSNGITGNGVNAYGGIPLATNGMGQNSIHISVYSRTNTINSSNTIDLGSGTSNYASVGIIINSRGSSGLQGFNNSLSGISIPVTNSLGFSLNNRNSNTQVLLQKNNIQSIVSNTATLVDGNGLQILRLSSFAANNTRNLAFATIGDGLTSQEALDLYTAIQNYQTTLGRQV